MGPITAGSNWVQRIFCIVDTDSDTVRVAMYNELESIHLLNFFKLVRVHIKGLKTRTFHLPQREIACSTWHQFETEVISDWAQNCFQYNFFIQFLSKNRQRETIITKKQSRSDVMPPCKFLQKFYPCTNCIFLRFCMGISMNYIQNYTALYLQ